MAYYNKKKSNIGSIILAVIVLVALVAGTLCAGFASRNDEGKWFSNSNLSTWHWADKVPDEPEPDDDTTNDEISLMTYSLDAADFEVYGISENALEAKVITVSFTPANTTNKRIGWTYKWKDPYSEWASGKDIDDYVDFVPAENFGASATIAVKDPFGEPVIATATSRANSELTSSCQFDYVARYDQLWDDGECEISLNEDIDVFNGLYTEDCYTVVPTELVAKVRFEVYDDLLAYLHSNDDDVAEYVEFENVTTAISWDDFYGELNGFVYSNVAQFYSDNGICEFGYIFVEMTCTYTDSNGNKVIYTFSDSEAVYFSDESIAEMAVPPTNIEVGGGGAF